MSPQGGSFNNTDEAKLIAPEESPTTGSRSELQELLISTSSSSTAARILNVYAGIASADLEQDVTALVRKGEENILPYRGDLGDRGDAASSLAMPTELSDLLDSTPGSIASGDGNPLKLDGEGEQAPCTHGSATKNRLGYVFGRAKCGCIRTDGDYDPSKAVILPPEHIRSQNPEKS
ncbi:hypothetical protein H072_10243 [Dactylellina haptotyla CBS 200.50]|uniref:Uncharacterized protein n=1 Tax=Dactylellina haptotyla (strain CBS 200.50) TaxID=1284197 RepID=S8A0C7_DACHA|nr:hypothetical protein H072_10243 [Dactylellina haptotyla CBS 200.50]